MARSWSDAHDGATSRRSSGKNGSRFGPSACGCSSRRRASKAGSAASQTPSDVRSWRASPAQLCQEVPEGRCCPVRGLGRGGSRLRCRGPALGPRPGDVRHRLPVNRAIRSPKGSITAARQFNRHYQVDENLVALNPLFGGREVDAGEWEQAGQGLPCLVPSQGLQQAGQGLGARG